MNFKRYVEASDTWVDSHYIHNTSTDTITTLPAELYPNDTTATVGLKGNMSQTGTPTPDNPIMPQGTGERTGNLFDEIYPDLEQGQSVKYKPIYVGDGDFTLSTDYPLVQAETADLFLLSGNVSSGASTVANGVYFGQNRTFSSVGGYVTIGYRKYSATHPLLSDYHTMLNTGSTALPYEPYGIKIPISSAGQTTPVYLGEVESTRRIKKLVLTGEENITFASEDENRVAALFAMPNMGLKASETGYCNILQWKSSYSESEYNRIVAATSARFYMSLEKSILPEPTLDGFITYLRQQYAAGTPVTVWYVLANEETAVVNEPIRKIGTYADFVSGITIPTTAGANTISVDTTLQPSEVTVNYKGWHPVADVHERDDGAWT